MLYVKNCISDIIENLENKRTKRQSIFEEIFKQREESVSQIVIKVKVSKLSKKKNPIQLQ